MNEVITKALLDEFLIIDTTNGTIFWKERKRSWFTKDHLHKIWNMRFAGKPALNVINSHGYKHGTLLGKFYKAHRIIWFYENNEWPEIIDHINGNTIDNRIDNLRNVTQKENSRNTKLLKTNVSGYHGVTWHKTHEKWQVQSRDSNGKSIYHGLFDDVNEAIAVSKAIRSESNGYHQNHGRKVVDKELEKRD